MLKNIIKEVGIILPACLLVTVMAAAYGNTGYTGKVVLVDKNCIDGKYITEEKEQFLEPNEFPNIQDLVSAFNKDNYIAYIYGILERRYPTGKSIIEQGGGESAVEKWMWCQ